MCYISELSLRLGGGTVADIFATELVFFKSTSRLPVFI